MTTLTLLTALLVLAILIFVVPAMAGQSAAQTLGDFYPLISAYIG